MVLNQGNIEEFLVLYQGNYELFLVVNQGYFMCGVFFAQPIAKRRCFGTPSRTFSSVNTFFVVNKRAL
jgi:hypothetical protein